MNFLSHKKPPYSAVTRKYGVLCPLLKTLIRVFQNKILIFPYFIYLLCLLFLFKNPCNILIPVNHTIYL